MSWISASYKYCSSAWPLPEVTSSKINNVCLDCCSIVQVAYLRPKVRYHVSFNLSHLCSRYFSCYSLAVALHFTLGWAEVHVPVDMGSNLCDLLLNMVNGCGPSKYIHCHNAVLLCRVQLAHTCPNCGYITAYLYQYSEQDTIDCVVYPHQ